MRGVPLGVSLYNMIPVLLMFVIFLIAVKYLWSYLVIRLFPGAVEQNLIVKEISWKMAIILALIFLIISS